MAMMEVMNILEMVCMDSLVGVLGDAIVCSVVGTIVGMMVKASVDG
jgi:hypothetical protein